MISPEDKQYIIERMTSWVAPLERPRETIAAPFIGTTFPQMLTQGLPVELVVDAVRICLDDGWANDPPWLVILLNHLNIGLADSKLSTIINLVRLKPLAGPDSLNSTVLDNVTPFVNRTSLRTYLLFLATHNARARPILVLNGDSKSGKSYSTRYIDYFSYNQRSIITYNYALGPDTGFDTKPVSVARDLVSMMGIPHGDIPEPDTNGKLYVQNLAYWVLSKAAQSSAQHWFIFDNFRGDILRADTRDFLVAFADRVTTGIFQQKCRLILINFDRSILTIDPGKLEEERIAACTNNDVRACIRDVLSRVISPVTVSRFDSYVLDNLPNDQSRMDEMNMRLRVIIRATAEVQRILAGLVGASFETVLFTIIEGLPANQTRLSELDVRLEALKASAAEV